MEANQQAFQTKEDDPHGKFLLLSSQVFVPDLNCISLRYSFDTQIWILNVGLNHKTEDGPWPQTLSLALYLRGSPSDPTCSPLAGMWPGLEVSLVSSLTHKEIPQGAELSVYESARSCFSPAKHMLGQQLELGELKAP